MFVIKFGDGNLIDLAEQADYEFPHPVQRWVMLLVAFEHADDKLVGAKALGTAFAIGPQLLVTAKHVLDPICTDASLSAPLELRPNMTLHALFVTAEPLPGQKAGHGAPIPISAVSVTASHDLAVLTTMTLGSSNGKQPAFMCAPLTVRPPTIGSTVLALGYAKAQASVTRVDEAGPTLAIDQRVMASKGRVEAHYMPRRDSVMVNFPAMQGDFPSLSGMSGGPVITEDGRVCGVVCSSVDSIDGSTWTSTCSLLPFLFAMPVDAQLDGVKGPWSIRDLADRGVVPTDGTHTKVQFEKDGQDLRIAWSTN